MKRRIYWPEQDYRTPPKWSFRWNKPDGSRGKEGMPAQVKTKGQAQKACDDRMMSEFNLSIGRVDSDITITAALESFWPALKSGQYQRGEKKGQPLKENTMVGHRHKLKWLPEEFDKVRDITEDSLLEYLQELQDDDRDYTRWTIKDFIKSMKIFMKHCRKKGYTTVDCSDLSASTPKLQARFYLDEEMKGLDDGAKSDPELLLAVRFGHKAGLRRGETVKVEWEDITWGQKPLLHIRPEVSKTGEPRIVPLKQSLIDALGARGSGQILRGWTVNTLRFRWQRLVQRVLVDGLWASNARTDEARPTYHRLRHTFVKDMLDKGMNLAQVMNYTGHKTLSAMDHYRFLERSKHDETFLSSDVKPVFTGNIPLSEIKENKA